MIAIDPDKRLFYEGRTQYGHAIWPSPVVTIATMIHQDSDFSLVPDRDDLARAPFVFREDSFDPVTRVRRGRFYERGEGGQPQPWWVQPHPALPMERNPRMDSDGQLEKQLCGFMKYRFALHVLASNPDATVALGTQEAMTLWRVVGVERISTGEDLVTLKARSNLGVLPELAVEKIPEPDHVRVREALNKVVETAYIAGPESIVDRCRDAAQAAAGAWMTNDYGDDRWRKEDLGRQARQLFNDNGERDRPIVLGILRILARLHARVKPGVQAEHKSPPLTEDDAQLAIQCVGSLLRELGWTR